MTSRRRFLKSTAAVTLAGTLGQFSQRSAKGDASHVIDGYGILRPVADESTGLPLLQLPHGFRYRSFGWTGDPMKNGQRTPAAHDGMGIVREQDGIITLIRNHELTRPGRPFGDRSIVYDQRAGGGCSRLRFDAEEGEWLDAEPVLAGTVKNCAGGPTSWGTWLSCEELVLGTDSVKDGKSLGFEQDHGWIFEVPADGTSSPQPLKAMGRFVHEATAIDPQTGIVYETEDRGTAGFYRFIPSTKQKLSDGGRLQMLKVDGRTDLRRGVERGEVFDCSWVDIDDPERAHSPGTDDELGVFLQGKAQKAATFARLEGCWRGNGLIYLDSTSGGDKRLGQIWQYNPGQEQLTLIYESSDAQVLESPDNLAVSPRGGLVVCEDGDQKSQRVHGLTPDGRIFPFAANNVELKGERNGFRGDYREEEWAGSCFSSDGRWLFINIQTPGVTLAITGPWGKGLL